MQPGGRLIGLIKRGREAMGYRRPVEVVAGVVLPRPDDFHGVGCLERAGHGLGDEIIGHAAAKATPQLGGMHHDIGNGQAGQRGGRVPCAALILRRHPQFAAALVNPGSGIHRLHGGVGQQGHFIDGFQGARRLLEDLQGAAILANPQTGVGQQSPQLRRDGGAVSGRGGGRIPGDRQGIAPLARGPIALGQYGHAAGDDEHLPHPRHGPRRGILQMQQPRAEDGRSGDAGHQKIGQAHVHAESGATGDLVVGIEPGLVVTDEAELSGRLEHHLAGHRLSGGLRRQFAISRLSTAGIVMDLPRLGTAFGHGHLPTRRCGGPQHLPGCGAGLAQRFP